MNVGGFCDINVVIDRNDPSALIQNWHTNLYRTIALNYVIDLSEVTEQKKKKKGDKVEIVVPEPHANSLLTEFHGKMTVLNRLTIRVNDVSQLPKLLQTKAPLLRKYDIIAVLPLDQSCIQQACKTNEVDLICMDCVSKPGWKLSRKLYNLAVDQNKYFEICYGQALRDASTLKNTIFMSHEFCAIGKSKNLIISSGVSNMSLLRSPYEVMHLSFIFGLGERKSRLAITSNPANLVTRALKRRQGKSYMDISL